MIDGITPAQSTFWKGLIAGLVNLLIGFLYESFSPSLSLFFSAIIVGVFAYGFSISLYILAAQTLGATRSQLIFASAPFFGVILSLLLLSERLSGEQLIAATVLIFSLIILFRDRHAHQHDHVTQNHNHSHRHDDMHHLHPHDESESAAYHTHWHVHKAGTHSHPHWPDVHHRHKHK